MDDRALIEWAADMTVDGKSKRVAGAMIIELDKAGARIGALREYFSSHAVVAS
jgi:hypothetical protein